MNMKLANLLEQARGWSDEKREETAKICEAFATLVRLLPGKSQKQSLPSEDFKINRNSLN